MELLLRIMSLAVGAFILGIALWFSLTLFAILFFFGIGIAVLFWLRAYLLEKEILNPTPGTHVEVHEEHVTVIEGDYQRVGEEQKERDAS